MANQLDQKKKASLASRILVAAILLAVFIPCFVLGGYYWLGFVCLAFIIGVYEYVHCTQKGYSWWVYAIAYLLSGCTFLWFIFEGLATMDDFVLSAPLSGLSISPLWIGISLLSYFGLGLFDKKVGVDGVFYLFGMGLLVSLGMQALICVRLFPMSLDLQNHAPDFLYFGSAAYFIFVAIATIMNDTWAYFVGIFFGKHKMIPSVSPNKTWEGFFGGWILGGLTCFLFALLSDYFGYPILPGLVMFGEGNRFWAVLLLSFALPLIGNLGDLSFSLIKRHFGTKDYGTILRAHGGVLDRVDSFCFTMIFAAIVASLSTGNYAAWF
ncbi:MAG: phosphatidate cytidylyltransferase [Firmicutes bacterium]|uniref:Phosphatidate cytidylyltransferase n=1 Tax=Candidatus Alloenteromonas pullistercoris TaxID=2840785 RepID=A0A9D9GVK0_9FIRM|nr:phosphatidate cytidylyltransferase [Candidatus Enteromonas pullistercoris]